MTYRKSYRKKFGEGRGDKICWSGLPNTNDVVPAEKGGKVFSGGYRKDNIGNQRGVKISFVWVKTI
jgi:hypothetical protein